MSLKVKIKNATELPNLKDESGLLDPYVAVKFRGVKKTTEKLEDIQTPNWNQTLEWSLKSPINPNEDISFKIYDKVSLNRRREIGTLNYNIGDLIDQELKRESLKLKPSHKDIDKSEWEKFRLNIELHYQSKTTVAIPSNIPLDYQVYVYVFKGRRLAGHHINPLVTVTCGKQSQTTISKIDNNNPVYNELKTFYYKSISSELSATKIHIIVRDDSTTHKSIIGYFTIDIGSVYNEQDHTLFNKWLVLCDPNDSMSTATGFLQVSISVRGPGDEPVYLGGITDNGDFESNLLRSVGVTMQPATLVTRIYHARDIPAVDPSSIGDAIQKIFTHKQTTHSADPYVTIMFDGHSEQTSVKSNDQNPDWNQQINIGYQYPSVCDKIVLQLKDKDRFFSADDHIGTCHINIPEIAVHGHNGYLPTFGPCYVNVYGSPQSGFSIFPDKYNDMNKGKLEGVAYRGRLLLEINTELGVSPKKKYQPIETDIQQKLERYVGKEIEYCLCVLFNGASLIDNDNSHIGFEVSIGNYSHTIDVHKDTVIVDGPNYVTVTWDNMKPLFVINCKWENCSYRVGAINIIDRHFKRMEGLLCDMNKDMSKQEMKELDDQIQFILKSCKNLLENFPMNQNCTKLDKNLREHRLNELGDLIDNVRKKDDTHIERLTVQLERFKALIIDPQYSIPDVIVWLLNNKKRISYCRIPSQTIIYSDEGWTGGRMSSKLQTLHMKTPRTSSMKPSKADHNCVVEMALSFGYNDQKDVLLQDMTKRLYINIIKHDQKTQKLILGNDAILFELRAYLLQARDLYSGDSSGLSDPYCIISFCGTTSLSKIVQSSITPKWYQTIALSNIKQYVKPEAIDDEESPPFTVVIQIYDKDKFGFDDYLGTVTAKPVVRLTQDSPEAVLHWHTVTHIDNDVGQLLAAFELIRVDGNGYIPDQLQDDEIPTRLIPPTVPKVVKVQCLGVRDMKDYQFISVKHPYIRVQCDEQTHSTGFLKRDQSMLTDRNITMKIDLPVNEMYSPPLNIFVYDKRFGYSPLIGSHSITSLKQFEQAVDGKQLHKICHPVINSDMEIQGTVSRKDDFDWWSKYYASIGNDALVQEGYPNGVNHTLTVFPSELEESFKQFTDDIVKTYPLYSGKGDSHTSTPIGYFKGIISVEDASTNSVDNEGLPMIYPQHVLVRVYIIKGMNLKPLDILTGKSDPYVEVLLGDHKVSNVEDYIPNTTDPIFGQMFEINAVLPDNDQLTITIKDHDYLINRDDTIGSTTINLENRFLSLHRALIGIPRSFSTHGINSWRDYMTPVDILSNACSMKGYNIDWSNGNETVTINDHDYHLTDYDASPTTDDGNNQHRLALYVLQQYNLVPEHIETRTLYKDDEPNIPQGQLHMWVDIIPKIQESRVIPPVINITPRKPIKYVFRIVVWSVADVVLPANQKTGDYYVTSLLNASDTQKTDIHYFAFGGEGQFNWRFVYPFDYDPIAKKIVFKQKEHFYYLDSTERSINDKIVFQVWDNDFFSSNDFLGQVEFCLHDTPQPAMTKSQCSLETLNRHVDLFKTKINYTLKGWLPIYKGQGEERQCTGKLNVWLEMVTEEEAHRRPAGKGRDDPNQYPELHKPDRPLIKFSFFESALKTFKFSIWKNHKCFVVLGITCLTLLVLILLII